MSEWSGDERRTNNSFNVKSAILSEISKTDDTHLKTSLLLMLGVLESNESGMHRIERKLDAVLKDEKKLKELVLNGHNDKHHDHHDWIEEHIKSDRELRPVCEWAKAKMEEDAEAMKSRKGAWQKFIEGATSNAGALIAAGAIGWMVAQWAK